MGGGADGHTHPLISPRPFCLITPQRTDFPPATLFLGPKINDTARDVHSSTPPLVSLDTTKSPWWPDLAGLTQLYRHSIDRSITCWC